MLFDEPEYFTVSEVNGIVRELVEENFPDVTVVGEVSNAKRHSSGHLYFTLKDAGAQLRGVCFRREAERIGFVVEDGMQVKAQGRLTIYEGYGQYQLVAYALEEFGTGRLDVAFRALKEKLEKEGLFDADRKRALPAFPMKVGVVTSPTGAAVRDIISTFRRRWPVEVLLVPVRVQGEHAAPEIAHAIERLQDVPGLDLMIVGRGGGSLEDLWAFNEEVVARAIYASNVPVISAVGHETDFTIADFVADVRAATPTMAAEIAVPLVDEVIVHLNRSESRLFQFVRARLDLLASRLRELVSSYALRRVQSKLESHLQAHGYAVDRLGRRVHEVVSRARARLVESTARLQGLDARAILGRGYTICSDAQTGTVLRSVDGAIRAGAMRVTFHDGEVTTEVKERANERR